MENKILKTHHLNCKINEYEFTNLANTLGVIYVVRDPISFAASANQQRAKGRAKSLVKINPIYKRRISGFLKGCGHENISTFKYEHLVQGGLIKAFSEIIGVSLEEKPRANESVTSEALALIYALNNINTPTRGSEINFKARETILNEIRTFFSKSNGFKKLMLTKFDLVDKAVAEDLVWLKKNFGISYQLPVKVNHQELVYDEYPSAECLSKFFRGYALKYEASISLADNIEKLYARFLRILEIDLKIIALSTGVDSLQKAHKKMMTWMKDFGGNFTADEILKGKALNAEKKSILEQEAIKVKEMEAAIIGSIQYAEQLSNQ